MFSCGSKPSWAVTKASINRIIELQIERIEQRVNFSVSDDSRVTSKESGVTWFYVHQHSRPTNTIYTYNHKGTTTREYRTIIKNRSS